MTASSHLTRVYGERMGRLSRRGHLDKLCEELGIIAPVLEGGLAQAAFRESFFGAGGQQEDWDKYVAAIARAAALQSESAPMAVRDEVASEEDALWQELTGELAEAEDGALDEAVGSAVEAAAEGLVEQVGETVEAAEDCRLSKWEVGEKALVVKVEGSFGAGEHGGARLLEEVGRVADAGVSGVVLDLSALSTLRLDSPAAIVACQMKAEGVGGRLALVRPCGAAAAALLKATGVTRVMECFDDVNGALEYVVEGMERGGG